MKTDNMSVIPPVSVRENRPCYDCVFYWVDEYYYSKNCNMDVETRYVGVTEHPCKYHITSEELRELIDNLEK